MSKSNCPFFIKNFFEFQSLLAYVIRVRGRYQQSLPLFSTLLLTPYPLPLPFTLYPLNLIQLYLYSIDSMDGSYGHGRP